MAQPPPPSQLGSFSCKAEGPRGWRAVVGDLPGDSWTRLRALPEPKARCLLSGGQEGAASPVWGCCDLGTSTWWKEDPSLRADPRGRGIEDENGTPALGHQALLALCPDGSVNPSAGTNPSVYQGVLERSSRHASWLDYRFQVQI